MCGFAGVIAWDDKFRTSDETLRRMSASIAHRGPDGEGYYINHRDEITLDRPQVALAFRRLAILDPDPRSNQPFTDGRHWLVFNGEIYNFRELKSELSVLDPQYRWRTTGDTEVLLRAYANWGKQCVERLNGMFAFAVWDDQTKHVFLARDRMGQKPLFVAYLNGNRERVEPTFSSEEIEEKPVAVVFASELAAILDSRTFEPRLDESGLTNYLQLGYCGPFQTIYRQVDAVYPASRVMVAANRCDAEWYWPGESWPTERNTIADDRAVSETRRLVTEATRRQLVSDVPLGCFLSGGIDSSVIAAAMVSAGGREHPVSTFSIRFDDPRYDESKYASEVARHLRTDHHVFDVTPRIAEDLMRLTSVFGEPFGDSSALPTHYLSQQTRQHVKVALSGDGGDELFGGYERYRAMAVAQKLRQRTTPLPWLMLRPLFRLIPGTHPKSRVVRWRRFLTSVASRGPRRYSDYQRLMTGDLLLELFGERLLHADRFGPTHNDLVYFQFGIPHLNFSGKPEDRIKDEARAAMACDRLNYLPGDLLTKIDRCSMLHALEVRSPFMDHELVQFAAGLTTDQLLKGGSKRMLREAFAKDLPDFVFTRKKMGFAVPVGEWFRGELRPMLRDSLFASNSFARGHFNMPVVERLIDEHEQRRVDHSQRLYALLMLELWWQQERARASDGS